MKLLIFMACLASMSATAMVSQQSDNQLAQEWQSPNAIPTSDCLVEPNRQIEIAVDVPGTLITLQPSRRGGVVKKGDVVVEIQKDLAEAELAELVFKAQSEVMIGFAEHSIGVEENRLNELKTRNKEAGEEVFTKNEIREQELAVVKAKAELAKAKEDKAAAELSAKTKKVELTKYSKSAEISGIVTDIHKKSVGTSIRQGDPIMTIVDYDEMIVKMQVDPQHENKIGVGDRVIVKRVNETSGNPAADQQKKQGRGSIFGSLPRPSAITVSAPVKQEPDYFFVGEVTFTSGQVKSASAGDARRLVIEAIVQNRMIREGNYLLKEGVKVEAIILPQ